MKRIALTLVVAIAIAYLAFPILLVFMTWVDDEEGVDGFLAAIIMMFFIQFISPFHFWVVPLVLGSTAAVLWALVNMGSQKRPR